jgi:hypothetical protein
MTPDQIAKSLSIRKAGQFFTVISRRFCKVRKGVDSIIEKESTYQGQLCEYKDRAIVKDAILSRERSAPNLPKGVKECFYLGDVKFFAMVNGNTCLAVNVAGNKPKSRFYKNNSPVEESVIVSEVLAQELNKVATKEEAAENNQAPFVMINVQNILAVS